MSRDVYLGIDLGSTTTKAVVMDPDGAVLGRGITNSRANYDVACRIAAEEALTDTRLRLLAQDMEDVPEAATAVARGVRHTRYMSRVDGFRKTATRMMEEPRFSGHASSLAALVAAWAESMGEEGAVSDTASDFFRDLASSRYMVETERRVEEKEVVFEMATGLFDRAILEEENRVPDVGFDDCVQRARLEAEVGNEPEVVAAFARAAEQEIQVRGCVGTGYGRARLPFPKESIRSEILCHGLGAYTMFSDTATVLDIGGQDTKAIQVDESGVVTSFQMNDRCAAGCGRYLGYIADELNLALHELGPLALTAEKKVRISSTCTVFAGAELRDRLALGERREDILAGLHRAIMLRAMSLLSRSGGIRDQLTFTGGVAKNPAAVRALRALVADGYGDIHINIAPESIYTGALGAALFARRDQVGAWEDGASGLGGLVQGGGAQC